MNSSNLPIVDRLDHVVYEPVPGWIGRRPPPDSVVSAAVYLERELSGRIRRHIERELAERRILGGIDRIINEHELYEGLLDIISRSRTLPAKNESPNKASRASDPADAYTRWSYLYRAALAICHVDVRPGSEQRRARERVKRVISVARSSKHLSRELRKNAVDAAREITRSEATLLGNHGPENSRALGRAISRAQPVLRDLKTSPGSDPLIVALKDLISLAAAAQALAKGTSSEPNIILDTRSPEAIGAAFPCFRALEQTSHQLKLEIERDVNNPGKPEQKKALQRAIKSALLIAGQPIADSMRAALSDVISLAESAFARVSEKKHKPYPQDTIGKAKDICALMVQVAWHHRWGKWPHSKNKRAILACGLLCCAVGGTPAPTAWDGHMRVARKLRTSANAQAIRSFVLPGKQAPRPVEAFAAPEPTAILSEFSGMSARQLAAELNERGIATPTGAPWSAKTVIRVRERMCAARPAAKRSKIAILLPVI